jgi:hypothetical protein
MYAFMHILLKSKFRIISSPPKVYHLPLCSQSSTPTLTIYSSDTSPYSSQTGPPLQSSSVYLSLYLSIYLSIHLSSIYLSIIYLSSIYLSIYPFISIYIYMYIRSYMFLCIHLSFRSNFHT